MSDKMREALTALECLYAWALSPNSQPVEKIVEKFQLVRDALCQQPESEPVGDVDHDDCTLCGGCGEIETDNAQDEHVTVPCPECIHREIEAGMYDRPQPSAQPESDRPWTELAACLYQASGAYDLPERILDVLSLAQRGEPFAHLIDGLLPCCPQPAQVPDGWQAAAKVALEFARCPGATNYPQNCIAHIEGLAKLILSAAPSIAEKREGEQ